MFRQPDGQSIIPWSSDNLHSYGQSRRIHPKGTLRAGQSSSVEDDTVAGVERVGQYLAMVGCTVGESRVEEDCWFRLQKSHQLGFQAVSAPDEKYHLYRKLNKNHSVTKSKKDKHEVYF